VRGVNLWRGRWLVGHVLVVLVAVGFIALGIWQYGRYQDEQDAKDAAEAAFAAPAPALTGGDAPAPESRVEVTGTYEPSVEALLTNRVRDGEAGYDVLTPLRLDDGSAVLVDRGWVPRKEVDLADDPDFAAPEGVVVVRGITAADRPLEPQDTVDERAGRTALPTVDLDRLAEDIDELRTDVWVLAQYQDPPPSDAAPALPEPPDTEDVNHMSYAFQWWAFALIPLIGWPIVVWRRARRAPTPE